MKKDLNHDRASVSKTGLNQSLDTKQIWDRLPAWLKSELMVIASLMTHPEVIGEVAGDICPKHFFKPESEATIQILLSHHEKNGRVLGWGDLEAKLKDVPCLSTSEINLHIRLLRATPQICDWHLVNTVLWFTNERRVFRGISDAAEAAEEQSMDWQDAMAYVFHAIDLPHLKDNGCLARIQAAILKCSNCAHSNGYCPEDWKKHLYKRA